MVSARSGIAARTFTLRVVGSIVGSTALIVPCRACFAPSIVTRTAVPTLTAASSSCGSVKSANVPPIASSVVTVVPGVRYWPTLTARMPSRPRNGARMILRSTAARSAAVSVVAVLSCASISSSCEREMTFPSASILERCAVRPASSRRASADAICARSTPASSSTSTWPSRAICPDSNRILLTVPGTSLLTETLRRLEMLPTAATVVSQFSAFATADPTASGGGPAACICFPIAMSEPIWAPLIPTRMATTTSKPATTRRYLFHRPGFATGQSVRPSGSAATVGFVTISEGFSPPPRARRGAWRGSFRGARLRWRSLRRVSSAPRAVSRCSHSVAETRWGRLPLPGLKSDETRNSTAALRCLPSTR